VNDIARVAGVSLATVDRVLNARAGVRDVTIDKVNKAIEELGYVRDTAAANLARKRQYRLLFIIPETTNEFMTALDKKIADQGARLIHQRTTLHRQKVPPFDPGAVVAALDAIDPDQSDGVALIAVETPEVCEAVQRTRDRGLAVVALVSDLPSSDRDHFVGIDNIAAGRTAARLMGRFVGKRGDILVITGSRLARDHVERRTGFDELLAEEFPEVKVVASIEGRDDPALIRKMLPEVFAAHPDLGGVYSSAAGTPGLIRFLEETGPYPDLAVVAHELTPASRAALGSGTIDVVINQDTGHIVRSATRLLRATVDRVPFDRTQERIRIDIYLKDNLPQQGGVA
jgi:LacI family transcriptional regulator